MWLTATALADPIGAVRRAGQRDRALLAWVGVVLVLALVGVATLPRQLALLGVAMPPIPDALLAAHQATVKEGLVRLIAVDRLVASPTVLIAGALVALAGESALLLPERRRAAVWAVAATGLAPLLVERVGELAIAYLLPASAVANPGDVITLPHRFVTGPLLLWWSSDPAPAWLEALDPRINLVTLWAVTIWAIGLRELSAARRWESWHVALPLGMLAIAGMATWAVGPTVIGIVLRFG